MDIDGASPQFTLTCISTGGPATTVTWTRDSTTVTEGSETVLLNPITAEYLHTLKVTGDIKGRYTCTVANNKPSTSSATIECEGSCMQPNILLLCYFSSDPGQPSIILACILAGIFHYCINFPQILASQALFLWQNLPLLLT